MRFEKFQLLYSSTLIDLVFQLKNDNLREEYKTQFDPPEAGCHIVIEIRVN